MSALPIPASAGELTAEWLTRALREGGALPPGGSVRSARCEVVGEGVGFVGQIARVSIDYGGDAGGAPTAVIAKLSSPNEGARMIAALYGLYEREVRFYQEIARHIALRVPACYHAALDAQAGMHVLLLEDLTAFGRIGDQVQGCTVEQAGMAIRHLGEFHAGWWDRGDLGDLSWLPTGADLVTTSMQSAYPLVWERFLELFEDQLTPAIRDVIPSLGGRIVTSLDEFADRPLTIVHGDFRLDNLVFADGGGSPLAAFDWQALNRGWGVYDVAYFLSGGLAPEDRRAHEMTLLRQYHETLTAGGVRSYPWETCREDYARSLLICLAIMVVNGATLEITNERAVNLFRTGFDRLVAAITDHDALALLPA